VLAISGKSLHDIFSSLDDLKIPVVDDFVRPRVTTMAASSSEPWTHITAGRWAGVIARNTTASSPSFATRI
jgi:hypothetical protein